MSIPPEVAVTTPSDTEIVLRRSFHAAPRLVFHAWTTPELLTRWYGAQGWQLVTCEIDLRVGGGWRFVSRGPNGSEMTQFGVYREIVPGSRLVYTERFAQQSYPGTAVVTHDFAEIAGQTLLTSTIVYQSKAARDQVLRYPMARGVAEGFQRLDRVLAELAGDPTILKET